MFLPAGHVRNFEELVAVLGDCGSTCLTSRNIGGFLSVSFFPYGISTSCFAVDFWWT
jgi:hypothetical protein